MIHRLAVAIGSVAAAAVLALGIVAAGFGEAAPVDAGQSSTSDQTTEPIAAVTDVAADTADPITQVVTETVYVLPPAKPKVINVTKRIPAATQKPSRTKQAAAARRQDREEREDREDREEGEDREDREEGDDD